MERSGGYSLDRPILSFQHVGFDGPMGGSLLIRKTVTAAGPASGRFVS